MARQQSPTHGVGFSLNPEAGLHRVTADPIELDAAARANDRSWSAFPYYELRYGDRGRRFGMSDGAWLIALCDLPKAHAIAQIRWLGGVLASRGMPRILLEEHLRFLHEELTQVSPRDRRSRYGVLRTGARQLAGRRTARVPETAFRRIADGFEDPAIPRMGDLLVSAVADEADGIANAVTSIEPWATDETRFAAPWIDAVRTTIATARTSVIPSSRGISSRERR